MWESVGVRKSVKSLGGRCERVYGVSVKDVGM